MNGILFVVRHSEFADKNGGQFIYIYIWGLISCKIFACFNFCLLCFALLRFAEHASESLDPSMCFFLRGSPDNMLVIPFIMG